MRKLDGFVQHVEVADLVGKDQNEPGIERGALLLRQTSMGLDQHAVGAIGIWQLHTGLEGHDDTSTGLDHVREHARSIAAAILAVS